MLANRPIQGQENAISTDFMRLSAIVAGFSQADPHQYHALPGSKFGAWVLVRSPLGPYPSLHRLRHSNLVGSALFAGFLTTMTGLDFPRPYIIGYGSSPSRLRKQLT